MSAIFHVCDPMPESERNARIYAGEIIVFRGFAAVATLVETLRAQCRHYLGEEPEHAHHHMSQAEARRAAQALSRAVRGDKAVSHQLNQAFAAIGMDLAANYGDGLKQRVQMSHGERGGRMLAPLAAHRDTWGSNIAAQTNWWAPTFATTPQRTLALYPAYFKRPVANDSNGWDFDELMRRLKTEGPEPDYPLLPLASRPLPPAEAVAISLVPGDLMCFSAAHLHASVPNNTGFTRLSFETRTVNGEDATAARGAPNVDGAPVRTTYQLFRRLDDRQRLGEMA